ncbi:hypothetical protein ACTHO0_22970 [Cytobacillus praedii]|uniref:hypothetical protein n=1 Tax=Cytobacillus praedii TaxID=1742358 RepID=UPI003F810A86
MDFRIDVKDVADDLISILPNYKNLGMAWEQGVSDFIKDKISFDEVKEFIEEEMRNNKHLKI